MKFIVKCAWCKKFMGLKDAPGEGDPKLPITHSICPECKRKLEEVSKTVLQLREKTTTNTSEERR